jgi:hypothetical protein
MAQTNYGVILSKTLLGYTTMAKLYPLTRLKCQSRQLNPPITARADIAPLFQANLLKLASSKRR